MTDSRRNQGGNMDAGAPWSQLSPLNAVTPLNAYFALIVTFSAKYQTNAGVGTLVALMLPYVVIVTVAWMILLALWQVLGLPWGL